MKNLPNAFKAGVLLLAFLFGSQSASAQNAITFGASQQTPITPEVELAQADSTPVPATPTPDYSGDGTTISGNFFTALFAVGGFTCCSMLVLIALIWFLNNRRQSS